MDKTFDEHVLLRRALRIFEEVMGFTSDTKLRLEVANRLRAAAIRQLRVGQAEPVGRVVHRPDTTQYGMMYTHLPAGTQLYTSPPPAQGLVSVPVAPTTQDGKDAARYRWLRASDSDNAAAVKINYWSEEYTGQAQIDWLNGNHLDAAIDAAMKGNRNG